MKKYNPYFQGTIHENPETEYFQYFNYHRIEHQSEPFFVPFGPYSNSNFPGRGQWECKKPPQHDYKFRQLPMPLHSSYAPIPIPVPFLVPSVHGPPWYPSETQMRRQLRAWNRARYEEHLTNCVWRSATLFHKRKLIKTEKEELDISSKKEQDNLEQNTESNQPQNDPVVVVENVEIKEESIGLHIKVNKNFGDVEAPDNSNHSEVKENLKKNNENINGSPDRSSKLKPDMQSKKTNVQTKNVKSSSPTKDSTPVRPTNVKNKCLKKSFEFCVLVVDNGLTKQKEFPVEVSKHKATKCSKKIKEQKNKRKLNINERKCMKMSSTDVKDEKNVPGKEVSGTEASKKLSRAKITIDGGSETESKSSSGSKTNTLFFQETRTREKYEGKSSSQCSFKSSRNAITLPSTPNRGSSSSETNSSTPRTVTSSSDSNRSTSSSDKIHNNSDDSFSYTSTNVTPITFSTPSVILNRRAVKRSFDRTTDESSPSPNSSFNSSGFYSPNYYGPSKRLKTRYSDSSVSFHYYTDDENSSFSPKSQKSWTSDDSAIQPEFIGYQLVGDSQFCRFGEQLLGLHRKSVPNSSGAIGICVSGQTITDLHKRVKERFYPIAEKIILMIGTNDFLRSVEVNKMCNELGALIQTLQETVTNIVLLTLPPIPKLEQKQKTNHFSMLEQYNSYIRSLSDGEKLRIADVSPIYFTSHPYQKCRMNLFEMYFNGHQRRVDMIHLNRSGLEVIRNYILEHFIDN